MKKTIAYSKKISLLFLTLFLSTAFLKAQITIKGKITDYENLPLQGVSITERGSAMGNVTDA